LEIRMKDARILDYWEIILKFSNAQIFKYLSSR